MAEVKSSRFAGDHDDAPRMVTLMRQADNDTQQLREIATIGAADAEDAARQAAILVLQQDGGLRIGDVVCVSRI